VTVDIAAEATELDAIFDGLAAALEELLSELTGASTIVVVAVGEELPAALVVVST